MDFQGFISAIIIPFRTAATFQEYFFQLSMVSVRSNNLISYGLKSRPGSCPFTPVVQGSGVLVTGGRKFPIGKAAGRNASEPISSLVKLMKMPTRWTHGEGRCHRLKTTEPVCGIFRGSRDGMLRMIFKSSAGDPLR